MPPTFSFGSCRLGTSVSCLLLFEEGRQQQEKDKAEGVLEFPRTPDGSSLFNLIFQVLGYGRRWTVKDRMLQNE